MTVLLLPPLRTNVARTSTTPSRVNRSLLILPVSKCRLSTVCTSSWPGCTSQSPFSNTTSTQFVRRPNNSNSRSGLHRQGHRQGHNHHRSLNPVFKRLYHPSLPNLSTSNTRWLTRQKQDQFTKSAKLSNLKSRAAFKLLQINERYRLFKPGMTVVDLGFAPGSWSQVAIDLVRPGVGRVVGVDIIPVTPPRGVSGLQGDFLSVETQARVRDLLLDESAGRVRRPMLVDDLEDESVVQEEEESYIERERAATAITISNDDSDNANDSASTTSTSTSASASESEHSRKCVDIVLSDMSAPWEITSGLWKNSLSNPYYRMMNTSGNKFKDHAGSMDLCRSALYFAHDTLKPNGHFVCKFYQGAEDKTFEKQLKAMFTKVHREKPESSRSESKESFFVGVKRLARVNRDAVFDEGG